MGFARAFHYAQLDIMTRGIVGKVAEGGSWAEGRALSYKKLHGLKYVQCCVNECKWTLTSYQALT